MRTLPPYPTGWYALCFADELRRGRLLVRPFMGRDLLLMRTASGQAAALDAYCPHLGAHMGRGGTVEGELLRCPFHGFRYNAQGACVATGYGTKVPPNAQLRTWPLREVNGMVLVYHATNGEAPSWEVPALAGAEWGRVFHRTFVVTAHPQETTENSVDLGHFSCVHGYCSVRMLRDVWIDGPHLSTAYAALRPVRLLGRWPALQFDLEFETHIYGLGYSQVDVYVRGPDLRARLWVLPTPIDAERTMLYLAASGSKTSGTSHRWLRRIPANLRATLIARGVLAGLVYDARQDFSVWENKVYVDRPALAHGDGPIGKYRAWAARFYAPNGG